MTNSLHPFVLTAILAGMASIAATIFAFRASRAPARIVLGSVALAFALPALYVFTLFHPGIFDARFRTYQALFSDIREGMTRDEVLALVERHYPPTGPRQRPKVMADEANHLGFFMSPETSREPNCEGIFLSLHNGHVTKKDYSPD